MWEYQCLLGENGILNRAQEAKSKTEQQQNIENETLANIGNKIDNYVATARGDITSGAGKLLWTNTTSTSSFAVQTITLPDTTYDIIDVYFKISNSRGIYSSQRCQKGITSQVSAMGWTTELNCDNAMYREFTFNTLGTVSFGNGIYYGIGGYSGYGTTNAIMIPMYIIGYKLGV